MFEKYNQLVTEGVTDLNSAPGDFIGMFDEAIKRLEAAKRGIGITNKLPPGEERIFHRHKIMGNLNRIRGLLTRIMKNADSNDADLGQDRWNKGEKYFKRREKDLPQQGQSQQGQSQRFQQ